MGSIHLCTVASSKENPPPTNSPSECILAACSCTLNSCCRSYIQLAFLLPFLGDYPFRLLRHPSPLLVALSYPIRSLDEQCSFPSMTNLLVPVGRGLDQRQPIFLQCPGVALVRLRVSISPMQHPEAPCPRGASSSLRLAGMQEPRERVTAVRSYTPVATQCARTADQSSPPQAVATLQNTRSDWHQRLQPMNPITSASATRYSSAQVTSSRLRDNAADYASRLRLGQGDQKRQCQWRLGKLPHCPSCAPS